MALAYSQFGTNDLGLYASYLLTHYGSPGGIGVDSGVRVCVSCSASTTASPCACRSLSPRVVEYLTGFIDASGSGVFARRKLDDASTSSRVGEAVESVRCGHGQDDAAGSTRDGVKESEGGGSDSGFESAGVGADDKSACCDAPAVGCERAGTRSDCAGSRSRESVDGVAVDETVTEDSRGGNVCDADAQAGVGVVLGCAERGKHYLKNQMKRKKRQHMFQKWRGRAMAGAQPQPVESGVRVAPSVCTVDTRTAVEIEAAQTLAERRVAENRLAVAQANARTASYADKDKSKALERLQAMRLSQRINQATAAANKAYDARDKSLTSVDSAGSAGEYALRQEIKAARNSQFLNEYLRKQNDILARYADSAALAAADRVPKPKFDDAYDVMKDQYDRADPEQVAQLDADVAVENARWNDVLNSGEGFVDDPPVVKKPVVDETLEELYAKVRAETEQLDAAQRDIDAAKGKPKN